MIENKYEIDLSDSNDDENTARLAHLSIAISLKRIADALDASRPVHMQSPYVHGRSLKPDSEA